LNQKKVDAMPDTQLPLQHIALVSETPQLSFAALAPVSAALQKQVLRDLAQFWGIRATVNAFAKLEDVPTDYWPMIVQDDLSEFPGAAGIHLDDNGHPFALISFSNGWSLTASHECLEMLCDPVGNTVRSGPSPKKGQGRVDFLVEVCDPSEDRQFGYTINGIVVSDFYTPQYFEPVSIAGQRYSFTGAIKAPREVLKGGYLSWFDPVSKHWFQKVWFGTKPAIRDLGPLTQAQGSIRTQIYRLTPEAFEVRGEKGIKQGQAALFTAAAGAMAMATSSRAKSLHSQILRLKKKA
jgi:hypothetical protein